MRQRQKKHWTPGQKAEGNQAAAVVFGALALMVLSVAWHWENDANTMQVWVGTDGGYGLRAMLAFLAAGGLGWTAWRLWLRH